MSQGVNGQGNINSAYLYRKLNTNSKDKNAEEGIDKNELQKNNAMYNEAKFDEADADGNGVLKYEEFCNYIALLNEQAIVNPENPTPEEPTPEEPAPVDPTPEEPTPEEPANNTNTEENLQNLYLYRKLNTNANNKNVVEGIDRNELQKINSMYNEDVFNEADVDKNGVLKYEEFSNYTNLLNIKTLSVAAENYFADLNLPDDLLDTCTAQLATYREGIINAFELDHDVRNILITYEHNINNLVLKDSSSIKILIHDIEAKLEEGKQYKGTTSYNTAAEYLENLNNLCTQAQNIYNEAISAHQLSYIREDMSRIPYTKTWGSGTEKTTTQFFKEGFCVCKHGAIIIFSGSV